MALGNKRSWTLLGYLCRAIGKHGKPSRIRTDNEIIFTGWVFTLFLKLAGIRHQRIQTCALAERARRIERLFGTLKPLLRQLVIPTKAALQSALEEFALFYNHARPPAPEPGWAHACAEVERFEQGGHTTDTTRHRNGRC